MFKTLGAFLRVGGHGSGAQTDQEVKQRLDNRHSAAGGVEASIKLREAAPRELVRSGQSRQDQLLMRLNPQYRRGKKPSVTITEKQTLWRCLKDDLKDKMLQEEWKSFVAGKPPEETRQERRSHLAKLIADRGNVFGAPLQDKAKAYVDDLLAKTYYELSAQGGVFYHRGTDLGADVIRTSEGDLFRNMTEITPEIRSELSSEHGRHYDGQAKLGDGRTGEVHIAERLTGNGARFVARKTIASVEAGRREYENLGQASASDHNQIGLAIAGGRAHLFSALHIRRSISDMTFGKSASHVMHLTDDAKSKLVHAVAHGMLSALEKVHERGIVHSDIHLSNLLISKEGEIILCDFGESRSIQGVHDDATVEQLKAGDYNAASMSLRTLANDLGLAGEHRQGIDAICSALERGDRLRTILDGMIADQRFNAQELLSVLDGPFSHARQVTRTAGPLLTVRPAPELELKHPRAVRPGLSTASQVLDRIASMQSGQHED